MQHTFNFTFEQNKLSIRVWNGASKQITELNGYTPNESTFVQEAITLAYDIVNGKELPGWSVGTNAQYTCMRLAHSGLEWLKLATFCRRDIAFMQKLDNIFTYDRTSLREFAVSMSNTQVADWLSPRKAKMIAVFPGSPFTITFQIVANPSSQDKYDLTARIEGTLTETSLQVCSECVGIARLTMRGYNPCADIIKYRAGATVDESVFAYIAAFVRSDHTQEILTKIRYTAPNIEHFRALGQ